MSNNEQIKRFIGTDDIMEFEKWINYMKDNDIDFKAYLGNKGNKWDCKMELIGYGKDEVEEIKRNIGFYLDED